MAEAGFEAGGCAAARAAGSAVVELVEGAPFLDAARGSRRTTWTPSWAGSLPAARHAAELAADALHRALGAAARDGAPQLGASPRRTLVAMSGGVDSAAAAQLAHRRRRRRGGGHARALGRPRHRRRAQLLLAAGGAGRPRARPPHGHPARDARPARALPRRRWWTTSSTATPTGARPTRACAATARCASTRCWPWPDALGAARLATGHYARIARDERGPLLRQGADPRKDQSYMLARLEPALLERLSFPLGGLTKDAVRALARDAGLPGGGPAREPGPVLRRRARQPGLPAPARRAGSAQARADRGHRRAPSWASTRASTTSRSASAAGIGVADGEPLYVVSKDAETATVTVGPRRRSLGRACGSPASGSTAGSPAWSPRGCATAPRPSRAARPRRRTVASSSSSSARPRPWRPASSRASWPATA